MHARHRSPGNGYRSTSMGMGSGSTRGHAFYNSEYRSFNNRGFGRGQGHPKSFQQPPQPPPRKGDILMEAGRLAAEYLVSKGLLPQSALSAKLQNGSFKNLAGDYQEFMQQEGLSQEARTSAHARLGGAASDATIGRRRYSDDFNSRNLAKGRRRGEYYRSYSSDWGREYGKGGSWSDRNRVSPDMEEEGDTVSRHYEEQQISKDVDDGTSKSSLCGLVPESEETAVKGVDEMGAGAGSSTAGKYEADRELAKGSDGVTNTNLGNKKMEDNSHDTETDKQITPQDLPIQHSAAESDHSGNNASDLLTLCKFAKVPTKVRSALAHRASKVDRVAKNEEENASDIGPLKGSEDSFHDVALDVSTDGVLAKTTDNLKCPNSGISKAVPLQSIEDLGELGPAYDAVQGKCFSSQSFPDRSFVHDSKQELSQELTGFGRSTSVKERGEKRAAADEMNEATKKPREWLPCSITKKADGDLQLSSFGENRVSSREESASPNQQVIVVVSQDSLASSHHFPDTGDEPGVEYAQEKQLFPSSFKICDLNLMEASDMNDNHRSDPVHIYPPVATIENEVAPVDIDLSISNSNISGEYARRTSNSKEIEVIDLENDSTPENKEFDNSERKMETAFTGTEGFPNHAHNAGAIAVDPDGLMISEFLSNFSSCSSVTEDINPLQNEPGLHDGEVLLAQHEPFRGTLGDDDSIYMSLGEIPLSFIPVWEQPTPRDYEKPF